MMQHGPHLVRILKCLRECVKAINEVNLDFISKRLRYSGQVSIISRSYLKQRRRMLSSYIVATSLPDRHLRADIAPKATSCWRSSPHISRFYKGGYLLLIQFRDNSKRHQFYVEALRYTSYFVLFPMSEYQDLAPALPPQSAPLISPVGALILRD